MRSIARNFYNTFSTAVVTTVIDVSKTMSRVKGFMRLSFKITFLFAFDKMRKCFGKGRLRKKCDNILYAYVNAR